MSSDLSSKEIVRAFRDAVARFLTSASNPGRAAAVVHDNTPGSPYNDLVLAKIEIDAMLDGPADEPCSPATLPTHDGGRYRKEWPTHEPPDDPVGFVARAKRDQSILREFAKPGECYELNNHFEWMPVYARRTPPPRTGHKPGCAVSSYLRGVDRVVCDCGGTSQPSCVHPWENIGFSTDGHAFCAACVKNLVKDPPWTTPPPAVTRTVPDYEFERLVADFGTAISLWTTGSGSRELAKEASEKVLARYYGIEWQPETKVSPHYDTAGNFARSCTVPVVAGEKSGIAPVPGSDLAEQIAMAQRAIAQWPADVKRAVGIVEGCDCGPGECKATFGRTCVLTGFEVTEHVPAAEKSEPYVMKPSEEASFVKAFRKRAVPDETLDRSKPPLPGETGDAPMKVRQYKDILLECLVTLRHARTFVTTREKMNPTGIELYDNLIVEVKEALDAPEPSLPTANTSTSCNCDRSSAWKCMNSTNDLVCGCKCHGGVYGTSPSED